MGCFCPIFQQQCWRTAPTVTPVQQQKIKRKEDEEVVTKAYLEEVLSKTLKAFTASIVNVINNNSNTSINDSKKNSNNKQPAQPRPSFLIENNLQEKILKKKRLTFLRTTYYGSLEFLKDCDAMLFSDLLTSKTENICFVYDTRMMMENYY